MDAFHTSPCPYRIQPAGRRLPHKRGAGSGQEEGYGFLGHYRSRRDVRVVGFYESCKANGVKPIFGCEVYVAHASRLDKTAGTNDKPYHLVLLAENRTGYSNLMKVVSTGFLDGFYYRPRVDLEILARYSKGLIALTGCLEGELAVRLREGRTRMAEEALGRYLDIYGRENLFIEIQRNGVPEQDAVNAGLIDLSKRFGLPLVATNDCHYLTREDARPHEVLLAIQTGTNLNDPKRLTFTGNQFYLKSPEEMEACFSDMPEALESTAIIADRCEVELDIGRIHLPDTRFRRRERRFDPQKKSLGRISGASRRKA